MDVGDRPVGRAFSGEPASVPPRLRLRVLGPLRVWHDDREIDTGPRQQRGLLALLVLRAGEPAALPELIGWIWGGHPPASAVNVVHKYVGVLRRLLEPGLPVRSAGSYLLRHGTGYRFVTAPGTLDLTAFRLLVVAAERSIAADRPGDGLEHYLAALALCHGNTGGDLADTPSAAAAFAAVDREIFGAVVAAADLAGRLRCPARVLGPLRLAAEMAAADEPVHARLITALAATGHQAEARARYGAVRDRLIGDLGIDPGPELREAQRRVLTEAAPSTARPAAARPAAARPAQRPGPGRTSRLPADDPGFAGRRLELGVLRDLVAGMDDAERSGPMVIAVEGAAGVGKSVLVRHLAHLVADRFPDGVVHLDLGRSDGDGLVAGVALRSLLHTLGVPAADVPDTFDGQADTYRSLTAGRRILLVLDDARDSSQLRPLLPNGVDSLVLITSRRPLAGLAACRLPVAVPEPGEAREMLVSQLAARSGARLPTSIMDEVVERCGRLPLALTVAAARSGELAGLRAEAGAVDAWPATLAWSYRRLSPGAARLFRMLSVALTPGITVEACVSLSGRDQQRTRADLAELTTAALLATGDDHGRLRSPAPVKAYAKQLFRATESPAERQAAVGRLLQHYLHSSFAAAARIEPHRLADVPTPSPADVVAERPASCPAALSWFTRHDDLLKEAVEVAAELGYGIVPWHLALTVQKYLQWYGHYHEWAEVMRSALWAAREQGDLVGEAHVLHSLARARWHSGAIDEAVALLGTALDIFGEQRLAAGQAMVHLESHALHTARGRPDLALASAETAAALHREANDGGAEIRSLECVGRSLTALGRYEEASAVLRRAADLGVRIDHHAQDASLRVAAARNLTATGKLGEAAAELRIAAATDGPHRFEALTELATLLASVGDEDGARQAHEQADEVLRSLPDGRSGRILTAGGGAAVPRSAW